MQTVMLRQTTLATVPRPERLRALIQMNDPFAKEIGAYAEYIFAVRMRGRPFIEAMNSYMGLCAAIMNVSLEREQEDRHEVSRMILTLLTAIASADLEYDRVMNMWCLKEAARMMESKDELLKVFGVRLNRFTYSMHQTLIARELFASFEATTTHESVEDFRRMTAHAEARRELAAGILQLRKYGIRPVFTQADALTRRALQGVFGEKTRGSVVYRDYHEFAMFTMRNNVLMPQKTSGTIGMIDLAGVENPRDLSMMVVEEPAIGGVERKAVAAAYGGAVSLVAYESGNLGLHTHYGLRTLGDLISGGGGQSQVAFEKYSFDLVMRLFDLTVPLSVTRAIGTHEPSERCTADSNGRLTGNEIQELVYPRLRALGEMNRMHRDLEEEFSRGMEEMGRRAKRHEYRDLYHLRQLPKGYRASGFAKARAAEFGVTLQEGETFVYTPPREGDALTRSARVRE